MNMIKKLFAIIFSVLAVATSQAQVRCCVKILERGMRLREYDRIIGGKSPLCLGFQLRPVPVIL